MTKNRHRKTEMQTYYFKIYLGEEKIEAESIPRILERMEG
jgi:hypothetical protein